MATTRDDHSNDRTGADDVFVFDDGGRGGGADEDRILFDLDPEDQLDVGDPEGEGSGELAAETTHSAGGADEDWILFDLDPIDQL